jgi:hypothetical protein
MAHHNKFCWEGGVPVNEKMKFSCRFGKAARRWPVIAARTWKNGQVTPGRSRGTTVLDYLG